MHRSVERDELGALLYACGPLQITDFGYLYIEYDYYLDFAVCSQS